eukprot:1141369-Pelagomonas_calceolata.AAC.2
MHQRKSSGITSDHPLPSGEVWWVHIRLSLGIREGVMASYQVLLCRMSDHPLPSEEVWWHQRRCSGFISGPPLPHVRPSLAIRGVAVASEEVWWHHIRSSFASCQTIPCHQKRCGGIRGGVAALYPTSPALCQAIPCLLHKGCQAVQGARHIYGPTSCHCLSRPFMWTTVCVHEVVQAIACHAPAGGLHKVCRAVQGAHNVYICFCRPVSHPYLGHRGHKGVKTSCSGSALFITPEKLLPFPAALLQVDCTREVELCREHIMQGFPSILVFRTRHDDLKTSCHSLSHPYRWTAQKRSSCAGSTSFRASPPSVSSARGMMMCTLEGWVPVCCCHSKGVDMFMRSPTTWSLFQSFPDAHPIAARGEEISDCFLGLAIWEQDAAPSTA